MDQLHVPLLYSQMEHSLVTFEFLELKKRHKLGIKLNPQDLWHHSFDFTFISLIPQVPKCPLGGNNVNVACVAESAAVPG